ncbi:MAG: A/G-specific adenine glycosylase [Oscillospiraceae bacterium]|nr:A/G-specific adenine glycosylase [Oscillospiraceae bacterium]
MTDAGLTEALLTWYETARRTLPFRNIKDPYYIWLSEIMAQQTRITALLPYFTAFVARFPTVADLAAADEHDVLKAWEGLGYYSRARNLRRAALCIMSEHGGQVPDEPDALRRLPGIGDYTAGAILSIAFGQKAPAVDGNVLRVHARIQCDDTDVTTPEARTRARVWVLSLMPDDRPGDMTQALMELGALRCLPAAPRCGECPAVSFCGAHRAGRTRALPVKSPKKPQRVEKRSVYLLLDPEGRVLMRRRTEALLHGLWEFPSAPVAGVPLLSDESCGRAEHVFTHIRWQMEGHLCRTPATSAPESHLWAAPEDFATLALPTAFRAFVKTLHAVWKQRYSEPSPEREGQKDAGI